MAFDNSAPLFPLSRCLYPWGESWGPMVLHSWELMWVIGPPPHPPTMLTRTEYCVKGRGERTDLRAPNKQQQPWNWDTEEAEIQQQWLCNDMEMTAEPELRYQTAALWGKGVVQTHWGFIYFPLCMSPLHECYQLLLSNDKNVKCFRWSICGTIWP